MNDPIVPRAYFRALGREAFLAGRPRDSHNMNWHAPALVDWSAGWDQAEADAKVGAEQAEAATA